MERLKLVLASVCLGLTAGSAFGQDQQDLTALSIEDLMNMEVTTTSKKAESLFSVPAAVYVITGEEIRASGARSIPDLLRMVPGISVQQTSSNHWMVASRGFVDTYTNKLLVMIDGRSLYTPTFGGVDWTTIDLIFSDIERIEVIRGPGGSLWGANAVNGIINIVTKHSSQTVGNIAMAGAGSLDKLIGTYRHGEQVGEGAYMRVWAKYRQWGETEYFLGDQHDGGNDRRGGFRYDVTRGDTKFMLVGEGSGQHYGQTPWVASDTDPIGLEARHTHYNTGGYSLQARLSRKRSENSEETFGAYFDHARRNIIDADENRDTFDFEAQRNDKLSDRVNAMYGVGYRVTHDKTDGTEFFFFTPSSKTLHYTSLFGQLEQKVGATSTFTIGAKLERNDYTGWEFQPSLRYLNVPDEKHAYWASVTRAVRTPTRFDRESFDLYFFDPDTQSYDTFIGSDDFDSEKLIAYEAGMRLHTSQNLLLDVAFFHNDYEDLRATMPGAAFPYPPNPAQSILPFFITNGYSGTTTGFELYGKWDASKRLRVFFSYAYLDPDLELDAGLFPDPTINIANTPQNIASVVSSFKVNDKWDINIAGYYQDAMPDAFVPASIRADVNLIYRPNSDLEAFLSLQNVTQDRFEGQTTDFTFASDIPRSAFFGLRWRY